VEGLLAGILLFQSSVTAAPRVPADP